MLNDQISVGLQNEISRLLSLDDSISEIAIEVAQCESIHKLAIAQKRIDFKKESKTTVAAMADYVTIGVEHEFARFMDAQKRLLVVQEQAKNARSRVRAWRALVSVNAGISAR